MMFTIFLQIVCRTVTIYFHLYTIPSLAQRIAAISNICLIRQKRGPCIGSPAALRADQPLVLPPATLYVTP